MRYGHIATSIAKVLLFGTAGSGKTSVTAIMTGEDPPVIRRSTPLMTRPVHVITILIGELTKWEKKTAEEIRRIIAKVIRSRQLQATDSEAASSESTDQDTEDKQLPNQQMQNYNEQVRVHSEQVQPIQLAEEQPLYPTLPKPKSEFDSVLKSAMKENDFLPLVQNCDPPSEPILNQRWLYIIDSGGQPEFHDMLSIFVQKATTCIFVCRMHDELDDYPPVDFYKDGSPIGPTRNSRLTNRQIFQQFMCTMRSFKSMKYEDCLRSSPNILLLATHRDHVEGGELPTPLVDGLKAIVLPQFRKQLIYCDTQLEKFIFTMNAKKPEDRDRKTAEDIRKVITEECPGEEVKIPIRWHNLDHQSRKISDHLNRKVLSREEYGKIAKELNIDEESCEEALEFFNSLNTIFYFSKALPDLVFLEPQILLNLLNELVAKKYRTDQHAVKPKEYDFQFHDFAQVTEELLNEFWEHYYPPLFTSKQLAILFEKLLIFGKLSKGKWFVPSILPFVKKDELEQYRVNKEKALLIHFTDGGPQHGIFCSVVSYLLSSYNTSPSPWELLKDVDPSNKPKCLKRNIILFTVENFPGKVAFIEEWTHFEIYVKTRPECEGDLWQHVHNAVFKGLAKAAEIHNYSNPNNFPQAAIICPEQDKDHLPTPHPATIDRKGNWVCTKSKEWFGLVDETIPPWLNLIPEVNLSTVVAHVMLHAYVSFLFQTHC